MSEHYRYLLLSVCRITFVDPSHDLFLNIAKSSWYAVELVSKDQAGSRSELKHVTDGKNDAFTQHTNCCLITLYNYCTSIECIFML